MRRVVITGVGVISPVGNDVETFWNSLVNGVSGIGNITKFDTTDFKVKLAAEVKDFDPTLYMDKKETKRTDLFTQYAIAAATQAMEDSKLEMEPQRLGVYMSSGIGGIGTLLTEAYKLKDNGPKVISPFLVPSMIANIASGNIAIKYNAKGPNLPVVTACATGAHSVGEAFRTIKHGYADAIIAGGTEAGINPLAVAGFTNCMALTAKTDPAEACVPFDKRRSGFVMGEGSAALVLEEYEHAKKRGAKVYGEILGYGNTCDAYHITAPDPEAEGAANAIIQSLMEAGASPDARVYINAHGTSTPLNDKTETFAIKKVFGEKAYSQLISSTKSMTAHMLGAAGAIEAIASLLALKNGIVPPTINYMVPDEDCDLNYVPNKAIKADLDLSLSVSLGFGGHNACLVFGKGE